MLQKKNLDKYKKKGDHISNEVCFYMYMYRLHVQYPGANNIYI